jgi:single-strand DNA-binding protein
LARCINAVILLGNLGHDPELSYTTKGTPVCEFSLAMNETWTDEEGKKQEKTTWMEIQTWGRLGEACEENLRKGSRVHVMGKLVASSYEDKAGVKRRSVKVNAEDVVFLDPKAMAV